MKKITLLIATTLLFAGCSLLPSNSQQSTQTPTLVTASASPTAQQASSTSPTPQARLIDITGENFSYGTKEVRVKKGEYVMIKFDNEGGMHNLVIDGLDVGTPIIKTGETSTIVVPTDKPGTYAFYCSVNNHREKGMEGKLIIE